MFVGFCVLNQYRDYNIYCSVVEFFQFMKMLTFTFTYCHIALGVFFYFAVALNRSFNNKHTLKMCRGFFQSAYQLYYTVYLNTLWYATSDIWPDCRLNLHLCQFCNSYIKLYKLMSCTHFVISVDKNTWSWFRVSCSFKHYY